MSYEFPEPDLPRYVRHNDDMWQTFSAMAAGFSSYLIHPSNGTCYWIVGIGENGHAEFFVEPKVLHELESYGLVQVKRDNLPEGIEEGYELTENGRQLFRDLKNVPLDGEEQAFLSWLYKHKRNADG